MSYAYPRVADMGERLETLLATYREAGGERAYVLFHNPTDGQELIARLSRRGRGLPARVIPQESFHIACLGLDLMLSAIAFGATQFVVLSTGSEAPDYLQALNKQMGFGETILNALGYRGTHFKVITTADPQALEQEIWALPAAGNPAQPAVF